MNVFIDFLHYVAAVTWIGGMMYIILILMPALGSIDPQERGKLLGAVSKRFSALAWGSVIVLLITGWIKLPAGALFNLSTSYGVVLNIKLLVVLLMIIIGLLITFSLGPKMQALAPKPDEKPSPEFLKAQKLIPLFSIINMILGVLVLLFTAIL